MADDVRTAVYNSPLGEITIASSGDFLIGLWFENQAHFGTTLPDGYSRQSSAVLEQTALWLDIYFSGRAPSFTPPIELRGTDFRREVWNILLEIPYGKTVSYGEIAKSIAAGRGLAKMSSRAICAAVACNPISLIVPCHRVVGSNGNLTGYAGGIERKKKLLDLERSATNAG